MNQARRRFVLATLALVVAVRAPAQARMPRLGVLLFSTPEGDPNVAALRRGLAELGYREGTDLELVFRYAEGRPERLAALAAELVALRPDAIFAMGGDVAPAARTATSTIPIVVAVSNDPVRAGLVPRLASPGGNLTGVTFVSSELAAKRLQLLKEAMPSLARVAVLWNPDHVDPEYAETQALGRTLGVQVQSLEVRTPADLEGAFAAALEGRAQALVVVSSRLMSFARGRIVEFGARQRLPVVAGWGAWAQSGALFSYGPDLDLAVRRAAAHVDKILKGAHPGSLPIEQPERFELLVNRRTASTLGLALPASFLARADRVIE